MSINSYEEYRTAAKVRKLDYDAVPGTSSGSNRSPGQFLKDGDHLKTLIKKFPFVNPNYLKNHVLNAFKDEHERDRRVQEWIQDIVENNLEEFMPKRRPNEIYAVENPIDPKKEALNNLLEVLPNVAPDFLKQKIDEFAVIENVNVWVQEILENDMLDTLPSREDFEKRKKEAEFNKLKESGVDGLEKCPFCPFFAIVHVKPEIDKIFKCAECRKESCRLCKRSSHIPLRCDEVVEEKKEEANKPFESIQDREAASGSNELKFKTVTPSRSVEVTNDDIDFRLVESTFYRLARNSSKISSIEFVINPELQRKFEAKKAEFRQMKIPETVVFAFHGTAEQNLRSICQSNLNRINRTAHGHGYYFSEFPDISLGYGQGLLMFKVLPGNEYVGREMNLHYGPNAQFQSKKLPANSGASGANFNLAPLNPMFNYANNVAFNNVTLNYNVLPQVPPPKKNKKQKRHQPQPQLQAQQPQPQVQNHQNSEYGDMLIVADNNQFVPYCIIHLTR